MLNSDAQIAISYDVTSKSIMKELKSLRNFVVECKKNINALKEYHLLICSGERPNLRNITNDILKELTFLALSDNSINILSDEHELSILNMYNRRAEIFSKSREDLESYLYTMLEARDYKLSDEVVGFAALMKLESLYNNIKDRSELELDKVKAELANCNLTQAETEEINNELIEVKSFIKNEILGNRKEDIDATTLRCINGFYNNLQNVPDDNLGINPRSRLERILNVLQSTQYKLSLIGVNLKGVGQYLKEFSLDGVYLELSPEQEDTYLTQEQRGKLGSGMLFKASRDGNLEEITNLIKNKRVNPNCYNSAGRTPLMTAGFAERVNAVRLLIELGANIDAMTTTNVTLIEGLAKLDDTQEIEAIIRILLDAGAKVSIHTAASLKFTDLGSFNTIWHKEQINFLENDYAPIHLAARKGHIVNVKWLEMNGADLKIQTGYGFSSLHLACELGHQEVAEYLVQRGLDINYKAKGKFSPIKLAIDNKHYELASMLKGMGARLDQGYETKLRTAIQQNQDDENKQMGSQNIEHLMRSVSQAYVVEGSYNSSWVSQSSNLSNYLGDQFSELSVSSSVNIQGLGIAGQANSFTRDEESKLSAKLQQGPGTGLSR